MEIVMQFGSVCSGIEAASVAWHPIGWKAAWLAEIEPFPCAVLAHHYPSVPNLGDMTTIARRVLTEEVPAPDVFCGGTPCQAFSVAGLRESLADERGNLTLKFVEIADAIDHVRVGRGEDECIVFWENVPGVLNTRDNAFGCFLAGLSGEDDPLVAPGGRWTNAGCVSGPQRTVAWRVLDAQYFGVAQRRRRVFVVASARKGFDPATVLFEWDGVRRDTAPSREARQTAPTSPARRTAGGGLGTDFDCDGGLIPALSQCITTGTGQRYDPETETILPVGFGVRDISQTLTSNYGKQVDSSDTALGPNVVLQPAKTLLGKPNCSHAADKETYVTHSLRGEGFDASEDGTGRGTPWAPMFLHTNKGRPDGRRSAHTEMVSVKDIVETLTTDGHAQSAVAVPVAYTINFCDTGGSRPDRRDGGLYVTETDTSGALTCAEATTKILQQVTRTSANGHGISPELAHTLDRAQGQCVAFDTTQITSAALGALNPTAVAIGLDQELNGRYELAGTLQRGGEGGFEGSVMTPDLQVRRLTPEECEALQGFPRSYTAIPWRGKPADQCPDGPRYKALGNSWAIPCVSWIGERIARQINSPTTSPHPAGFFKTTL